MSDYVFFQMWGPLRQSLIDGHLFYVEQAEKRLLSQFEDIEAEADKAADEWLEKSKHLFDPDRHDPGTFYEAAFEAGIEFYSLLCDMRVQTRLSVVAGMFHEWDKQLRGWLAKEIQHWPHGKKAISKLWAADFRQLTDLLESLGFGIRSADYFRTLDACRLVINVYKHGEGKSLLDLKQSYPEYLADPSAGARCSTAGTAYRDHTELSVSEEQLKAFSDAIVRFWQEVPENVFASQIKNVPDWFEKATSIDQDRQKQSGKK